MSQPMIVKISVTVGPNNPYGESTYKFERVKTLNKNTHQEFAEFIDNVGVAMKSESSKLTVLQAAFVEARNHALEARTRMDELEDKSEKKEEAAEAF